MLGIKRVTKLYLRVRFNGEDAYTYQTNIYLTFFGFIIWCLHCYEKSTFVMIIPGAQNGFRSATTNRYDKKQPIFSFKRLK